MIPQIIRHLEAAAPVIAKLVEEADRLSAIEEARRQAELERLKAEWEAEDAERKRKEAERRDQRQREEAERQREEAEQRRLQAIVESREQLSALIDAWGSSKQIEAFFEEVERQLEDVNAEARSVLLDRLRHARELLGSPDALQRFREWKAPS